MIKFILIQVQHFHVTHSYYSPHTARYMDVPYKDRVRLYYYSSSIMIKLLQKTLP